MNPPPVFSVVVSFIGYGRFQGGTFDIEKRFADEKKARDYYTDMLVRYPKQQVTFKKI